MEGKCSGLGCFIELEEWNRAVVTGRLSGGAAGDAGRKNAVVSVVEERKGEFACRVRRHEGGAVLGVEPVSRVGAAHNAKSP